MNTTVSAARESRLDALQEALDRRRGYVVSSLFVGMINGEVLEIYGRDKSLVQTIDIKASPRTLLTRFESGYIDGYMNGSRSVDFDKVCEELLQGVR